MLETPAAPRAVMSPRVASLAALLAMTVLAAVLLGLAHAGRWPLAAGLAVSQLLLVAAWFRFADLIGPVRSAGSSRGPALIGAAGAAGAAGAVCAAVAVLAGVVADVVLVVARDHTDAGKVLGVFPALVGAAFVVQLARRTRAHLTELLLATVGTGALAIGWAVLIAVRDGRAGMHVVTVALVAAVAAALPVQNVGTDADEQRAAVQAVLVVVGAALGCAAGLGVAGHVVGAAAGAAIAAVSAALAASTRALFVSVVRGPASERLALMATVPLVVTVVPVLVVARIMVG